MNRIEALRRSYARHVGLPWEKGLSGVQKVWFAVYDKEDERRLRRHIEEFEIATKEAGHGWRLVDLTDVFGGWMAVHSYREQYYEEPQYLDPAIGPFHEHCVELVKKALSADPVDEDTVVGVQGVASLYGLMKVSQLVNSVQSEIRGRLLVFFPGEYESDKNSYRLLDARDGWNYMAVPITASEG